MKKKEAALLAVAVSCWLSSTGAVVAEDMIYYGSGDGNNTGNIFGVNWVLDKDYSHNGGRQYFFGSYTNDGTASNNTLTINGGTYAVDGDVATGANEYTNYFYNGFSRNGSATDNSIIINSGNFVNKSGSWQAAGIYAANAVGNGYVAANNSVTVHDGTFQGYTYISAGLGNSGSDATNNTVTVNGGEFEKGVYIFGGRGYKTGNTDKNTVNVTGGTIGGNLGLMWRF